MSEEPKTNITYIIKRGFAQSIAFIGCLSIILGVMYPALSGLGYELIQSDRKRQLTADAEKHQLLDRQLEVCEKLRVDDIQSQVTREISKRQAALTELLHAINRYEQVSLAARFQIATEGFRATFSQAIFKAEGQYIDLDELDLLVPDNFMNIPGVDSPAAEYSRALSQLMTSLVTMTERASPRGAQKLSDAILEHMNQNYRFDIQHNLLYQIRSDTAKQITELVDIFVNDPSNIDASAMTSAIISYHEYHPLLRLHQPMLSNPKVIDAISYIRNEAALGQDLRWFQNTVFYGPFEIIPQTMRNTGLVLVFETDDRGNSEFSAWEYTDDIFLYGQATQSENRSFLAIPLSRDSYFLRERLISIAENIEFGTLLQ